MLCNKIGLQDVQVSIVSVHTWEITIKTFLLLANSILAWSQSNEFEKLSLFCFVLFQKQTTEIKEKYSSVMAELAKVEPAVQDAKMGEFYQTANDTLSLLEDVQKWT